MDLIDRQAAIDALHMHLMYRMGTDSNKKRLDEWINNLPSAQPEIIRCKDCDWWQKEWSTDSKDCYYCPMVDEAVEHIKAEQDWIPCEKPPTENNACLVTVHPDYVVPGGGQVDILVWVDDDWFYMVYDTKTARYQITRFPDPVIAWRPLPTPYKEAPHEP